MSRRRILRLPSSSDEEETPLNSNRNPPQPAPPSSSPVEISDDEEPSFFDASDDFSIPIPNNLNNPDLVIMEQILERFGLRLRREWMIKCVGELERAGLASERIDINAKAKLCFEQVLFNDLNYCGAGILPANISGMHNVELQGPFVLQVDEMANICSPLRERYHKASAGSKRCLKLSLTDGVQRVFGMEYRPIKDLDVTAPAGFKVVIRNIQIRRGLIMLVPEVIEILGGMVEELEAAHKRLVHELDKPPRGKRKRGNDTLPLAKRASLAAWASTTVENGLNPVNISIPPGSNNAQVPAQVRPSSSRVITEAIVAENHDPSTGTNNVVEANAQFMQQSNTAEPVAPYVHDHMDDIFIEEKQTTASSLASTDAQDGMMGNILIDRREITASTSASRFVNENSMAEKMNSTTQTSIVHEADDPSEFVANSDVDDPSQFIAHVSGGNADAGIQTPSRVIETDEMDAWDVATKLENPLTLDKHREIPFTYLASLLAKWVTREVDVSSIQGKVKVTFSVSRHTYINFATKTSKSGYLNIFLNGNLHGLYRNCCELKLGTSIVVWLCYNGFQFRNRSVYELRVYIDDGSLISEIIINHDVVQKCVGHSPEEVNTALASTDNQVVMNIKETMKKFQLFLSKFEGTILLELNENFPFPVALEMNQGCSVSDAWMLLQRLGDSTAV